MDINQKGNFVELMVMSEAIKHGYIISIPYGSCDRYDQIWDKDGKLIRVQVKAARWRNAHHISIYFNCYSVSNGKKKKYSNKDIDFFATYWNGKCYLIPVEECGLEKTLWFIAPKNGCKKCTMACGYELV